VLDDVDLEYRVSLGDREVGRAFRRVELHAPDSVRFGSRAEVGPGTVEQSIVAGLPGLDYRSGVTTSADGRGPPGSLRREGDRLVGTLPGGRVIDLTLPDGAVVADLLEPSLWAADLEAEGRYRAVVTNREGTDTRWAAIQVAEADTVTVPGGTFPVYRVEVTGPENLTLWVLRTSPHLTVRLDTGTGVVLELVQGATPAPSRPGGPSGPPFPR